MTSGAGSGGPTGQDEVDLELTYQILLAPWWQIQPDVQYIVNPRSATEPTPPAPRRGNALVLGYAPTSNFRVAVSLNEHGENKCQDEAGRETHVFGELSVADDRVDPFG